MEHEVFVPLPAETLRQVLRDPARVARCLPGLQQDADASAGPLTGRLKVRIGGHTITYRGTLRIVEQGDVFAVEGEGVEARGTGSAKVTLTIRPAAVEGGTTLSFTGTSSAEGRLAELADTTTTSAAHRLLDRFADRLAVTAGEPVMGEPAEAETDASTSGRLGDAGPSAAGAGGDADAEKLSAGDDADADGAGLSATGDADAGPDADASKPSIFDAPVPPPSLDAAAEEEFDAAELPEVPDLPDISDEPPAEAAHARRTMIGRSAEEVDHAPPRGRYAPTPAPDASTAGATLRWIAPAAAFALASAVVVGRALRRRK
jgi:carbon monoxide dehydrogenase subunit G